jgi:hypothetical protein
MPLPIDARDHPTGNHHLSTPLENGNREPRNRLGPKPAGAPRDLAAASIAQAPEHGKAAGGSAIPCFSHNQKKSEPFFLPQLAPAPFQPVAAVLAIVSADHHYINCPHPPLSSSPTHQQQPSVKKCAKKQ